MLTPSDFSAGYNRIAAAHGKNVDTAAEARRKEVYCDELAPVIDPKDWPGIVAHMVRAERFPTLAEMSAAIPRNKPDDRYELTRWVNSDCVVIGCIDGLIFVPRLNSSFRCEACNRVRPGWALPYREDKLGPLQRRTPAEMRARLRERADIAFKRTEEDSNEQRLRIQSILAAIGDAP
jgi:hypothetical protein